MRTALTIIFASLALSACVSNQAVRTIQPQDFSMNCEQLQFALADLGADFEDAKDDSGITGRNVGLALVFWPGIIVNEVRANKNQDSIDDRIAHLTSLYSDKCVGQNTDNSAN